MTTKDWYKLVLCVYMSTKDWYKRVWCMYRMGSEDWNNCSVNPSDLSKMLVKKQMKYFDVPLEHAWKVPVF